MNFAKPVVLSDSLKTAPASVLSLSSALDTSTTSGLPHAGSWHGASTASAIAFVDSTVTDYQTLIAGVAPGTEIHVLDSSQDAITQITNTLLGRHNISSLHIVSHGETGGLDFGGGALNLADLPQYAAQLKTWSNALTNDADILLYGCNVAQGELGKAFTSILSQLTGADIAASDNLTGKGGDWNLEVATGNIESTLAFQAEALSKYGFSLNILGDTFKNSDVSQFNWIYNTATGTPPVLTARSSTSPSQPGGLPGIGAGADADGSGALRLTSAAGNQASFAIYNLPINAASGLSITFNVHAYGGNGADGISFFLIDGNANPTASGATGGALGYAYTQGGNASQGLAGGYLGIGFDEFGNFSSVGYGSGGVGQTPDSIAVRGSQSNSYKYLTGTSTLLPGIDNTLGSRSTAQKKVQIDITPAGLLSVKIDLNNDGVFSGSNEIPSALQNYNVVASNGALPSTFKFGFSASTGGSTNIHEITGMNIDTYNGAPYIPLIDFSSTSGTVTEGNGLTLTARLDAATTNTVTIPLNVTGGTATGGGVDFNNPGSITIAPGQLTGSVTLNTIDDTVYENTENVIVGMGSPTNGQLRTTGTTFTGNITDNDLPLFGSASNTVNYTENSPAVVINPNIFTTNFSGAPPLSGATISITSGFDSTQDRLGISGQSGTSGTINGLAWSYNTSNGILTVTGSASQATYNSTLNQVTYSNNSDAPTTASRSITYAVQSNNGPATASPASSVTITAVNDAPIVSTNTLSLSEGGSVVLSSSNINATDPDNTPAQLTFTASTISGGQFELVASPGVAITSFTQAQINSGAVRFVHDGGETAPSYKLSVTDGSLTSGSSTVTIGTFTNVNDAPTVTAPTAIAVIEDTPTTLTGISFTDVDAGSGSLSAVLTVGAGTLSATAGGGVIVTGNTSPNITLNGTLTALNSFLTNSLTYTPGLNTTTAQTLGVRISDNGNTGTGGALSSAVTNVALNITAVNDAPSFTKGSDQTITAGAGTQIITNWATGFNPGPADEASQTVQAYELVNNDHPEIFAAGPAIDTSGNLVYAPAISVATPTTATISVRVRDSGGTANGGIDTSAVQTFTITVKPQPTISITPVTQNEGNSGTTAFTFTVNLSDTSTQTVQVNYATADGTATIADGDYTTASGTLTFAPGETSKTFTVNANGDTKYETTEAFAVNLSNAVNGAIANGSTSVNGTITNDDTQPTISIGNVSQNEGNNGTTAYTFTVSLSNASAQTVAVNYATADGTATVTDSDYVAANGTLSFNPGETSKTITVLANGDTKFEADQTFSVGLSNASNGTLGTSTGTGTIINDDTRPTLSINSVSQNEGYTATTAYNFTVSLSNASDETVTVNYATDNGTATLANSDYTAATNTLTFNAGETSKTLTVNVNGDTRIEKDETFVVNLTAPTKATIATATGTGTIVNDDYVNLIWRNTTTGTALTGTGENSLWQMNSTGRQSGFALPKLTDLNWQIAGRADFNSDGNTDLLWRNRSTGENMVWTLNNYTLQSAYAIQTISDTNWQIAGTADFNHDGKADILWRNRMTGANTIWELNGSLQTGHPITTIDDINWQIADTADFNNDGTADILWRNRVTGENVIWQMNNFSRQTGYSLPVVDQNWQVAGTGDFNQDGIADIFWYNKTTGEDVIWQMNGTGRQSGFSTRAGTDLNWQIAGIADLNGDGMADILWRNQQASKEVIWQMNGFSYSQTYQLPDVSPEWIVKTLP